MLFYKKNICKEFLLDKLNKHVCGLNTTQGYESIFNPVWSCECLGQTDVLVSWCILVRW